MFEKVLIANRGEIAIRVARTLKEMGIGSVAVYSEIDRDAPHVREADEAFLIGPAVPAESYLNVEKIIETAKQAGAEAIHPGYGFLAENPEFANACADAGIVFIGPPAEAIEAMGSKTRAREIMAEAGVPIVPGATEPAKDLKAAMKQAEDAGYPVACKAAGGGGGKGFRVAMTPDDLEEAFEGAAREGEKFFSDDRVYVERYLEDPRHVEVQVLADSHGNVIHLGERDCSIQRRHQKVIEEAPGPHVDAEMRERIGRIATDAAAAVGYRGAGTVEGMQVGEEYFFLEMNTRVQVEHCVTEMVTGIDIVREQILVAAGEQLSIAQDEVELRGWAIECRINAEAAHKNFAPAPGAITTYREPAGPGRAGRLGRRGGLRGDPDVRPDGRQADRLGRRPREGDPAHAAGARRVRGRRPDHADPLPQGDPRHRAVGEGGDLPRPDGGQELAEVDRPGAGAASPAEPDEDRPETVARDYKVEVSGKLFDVKVIGEAVAGIAPAAGGGGAEGGRRSASASRAAARAPPARRCPRPCRARSSRSPSRRAPRSPRAI